METKLDLVTNLLREGHITPNQSRILLGGIYSANESYYVVEKFGRYVDGVYSFFASEEPYEKTVRTIDSLLECDRYETYEQAKEFADKYNCNVRKVIVKVEDIS